MAAPQFWVTVHQKLPRLLQDFCHRKFSQLEHGAGYPGAGSVSDNAALSGQCRILWSYRVWVIVLRKSMQPWLCLAPSPQQSHKNTSRTPWSATPTSGPQIPESCPRDTTARVLGHLTPASISLVAVSGLPLQKFLQLVRQGQQLSSHVCPQRM